MTRFSGNELLQMSEVTQPFEIIQFLRARSKPSAAPPSDGPVEERKPGPKLLHVVVTFGPLNQRMRRSRAG